MKTVLKVVAALTLSLNILFLIVLTSLLARLYGNAHDAFQWGGLSYLPLSLNIFIVFANITMIIFILTDRGRYLFGFGFLNIAHAIWTFCLMKYEWLAFPYLNSLYANHRIGEIKLQISGLALNPGLVYDWPVITGIGLIFIYYGLLHLLLILLWAASRPGRNASELSLMAPAK